MQLHIEGILSSYSDIKKLYPNTLFTKEVSEQVMRELGHFVDPTPRPDGDVVTQGSPEQHKDGTWHQTWTARDFTEDELAEQQAQRDAEEAARHAAQFTFKTDIWQRCTEGEAETLDDHLLQAPVRMRRMWDDCLRVEHSSELFGTLKENMIDEFGDDRTNEILAPSEDV